jgi:mono/diheme cytochrome c family protein
MPSRSETSIAVSHWPDANVQSLREGHLLYTGNCARCHELYRPMDYSELYWTEIIPEMARKAHLNEKQEEEIRRYILSKREAESKVDSKSK